MTVEDDDELTPQEALRDLLETLVDAFGLDAAVTVDIEDSVLVGAIVGEDVDAIVGERGSVLDAVQHLAQRVALRGGEGLRVSVDAGGYRGRREAELRAVADAAADAALAQGHDVELAPMPAAERRFVHEHLRERGDVDTHSEGDEPRRRLIVTPL